MHKYAIRAVLLFVTALGAAALAHAEDYLGREDFLAAAFAGVAPQQKTLWVDAALRERAREVVGFEPGSLRIRYWEAPGRTAWILDETGKERPITFGVVIDGQRVQSVQVMSFRESRGWEIRYPFFTGQFAGAALGGDGALDRPIDGITGATLSANAASRVARLALWLDGQAVSGVARR